MTRLFLATFLAVVFLSSTAVFAQDDEDAFGLDLKAPAKNAIETYIFPAHDRLHLASKVMDDEMRLYCRGRARPVFDKVSEQFKSLTDAWAGVFFFRFGPWEKDDRLARFIFWPDRKGRGLRQVRRLLKKQDYASLAPEKFVKRSVALQGVMALEYLIFVRELDRDKDSDAQKFACAYAQAITANLSKIAKVVSEDWRGSDGYGAFMLAPGRDNALYRNDGETALELVKATIVGLRVLRDQMVTPVLGLTAEKAKPKKAFLRRSDLFFRFTGQAIKSLKDYIKALQLVYFIDDGLPWIKQALTDDLDLAFRLTDTVKMPLNDAVKDEGDRRTIGHIRFMLNKSHQVIAKSVIPGMGIKLGFNALDGD